MHQRIINDVLENMDSERAEFFTDVVAKIENDPRTDRFPNYVYLLLKETMPLLPTYLDKSEFIDALFDFITDNYSVIKRTIFNREYIYDQSVVKTVTNDFVIKVVDLTLQHYQAGDIDTGEKAILKFTWPYREGDLVDPDDDDADEPEVRQSRPPYSGPERRKKSARTFATYNHDS